MDVTKCLRCTWPVSLSNTISREVSRFLQGSLGDQFFGKVVVKITFFHNSYAAGPTCTPVK